MNHIIFHPLWTPEQEKEFCAGAMSLDEQAVDPGPVKMCKRCVITNKRPRITFDEDGICSACRYAEEKGRIDWGARNDALHDLLHQLAPAQSPTYGVVVPASGGKDSSHVALTMRELGRSVMLARWAPLVATEIGERNWQALIHSGFDSMTAQPNGLLTRKLARIGLEYFGDPFLPFIFGQLAWPFHVANMIGSNLVFFGENGEAEYGGDTAANNKPCWTEDDWDRVYMKGGNLGTLIEAGLLTGVISMEEAGRVTPLFRMPEVEKHHRPQFHWLGYYRRWRPQENYYRASDLAGFEPRPLRSLGTHSTYASLDDCLDHLHYFLGYVKFGIGRCTSDCCHEIRDGELDRSDALSLVEQFDGEYPAEHMQLALSYLGMTEERFREVCYRFKAPWVELPF